MSPGRAYARSISSASRRRLRGLTDADIFVERVVESVDLHLLLAVRAAQPHRGEGQVGDLRHAEVGVFVDHVDGLRLDRELGHGKRAHRRDQIGGRADVRSLLVDELDHPAVAVDDQSWTREGDNDGRDQPAVRLDLEHRLVRGQWCGVDSGSPGTPKSHPASIMITAAASSRLDHRDPGTDHLRLLCVRHRTRARGQRVVAQISVQSNLPEPVRFRAEDSPRGLWRSLGKRVGCKPSRVRIPHPPRL